MKVYLIYTNRIALAVVRKWIEEGEPMNIPNECLQCDGEKECYECEVNRRRLLDQICKEPEVRK